VTAKSFEISSTPSTSNPAFAGSKALRTPFADRTYTKGAWALTALALVACSNGPTGSETANLVAVCADPTVMLPAEDFECGETHTIECTSENGTTFDEIQVPLDASICAGATLEVNDPGPYDVGEHTIVVTDAADNDAEICTATLIVEDTSTPTVAEHEVSLWPPNHKFHTIDVDDCVTVTDDCDGDVEVEFLWASSDEVVNGLGDGNHEPDIRNLTCGSVELRAERSGNENGRVYHLGWRAWDDDDNTIEGVCTVRVQHDRSGRVAVDDGEAYRIDAPAECGDGGSGSGGGGSGGGGSGSGGGGGGSVGGGL
jgi:uncharacterized membrane protein YgcG